VSDAALTGTSPPGPEAGAAERGVLIEVSDLHKHYDRGRVRALDGLDLRVGNSEFVAVTGPSGSGKSTLLHLIAALDSPTSGRIVVGGEDVTDLKAPNRYRRDKIGLVFQLHNLLPHLTAQQNVEIAMIGTSRKRAEMRARAAELLDEVGLARHLHRKPPELSGGERQRVAIARALANEPSLLLADEPTGSLDSEAVEATLRQFRELRDDRGVTVILITHDREVAAAADRLVTIRDGKVVDDVRAERPAPSRRET